MNKIIKIGDFLDKALNYAVCWLMGSTLLFSILKILGLDFPFMWSCIGAGIIMIALWLIPLGLLGSLVVIQRLINYLFGAQIKFRNPYRHGKLRLPIVIKNR